MMLLQGVPLGLTGGFDSNSDTKIDHLTGLWCMDLMYRKEFPDELAKQDFDDLHSHLLFMLQELGDHLATACKNELNFPLKPNEVRDRDLSEADLRESYSQPFLLEVTFELQNHQHLNVVTNIDEVNGVLRIRDPVNDGYIYEVGDIVNKHK